ncbi:hypothetical protein [Mycobacteroides salmoniphilum]|uniref:Uncharacterized protein n=1 Tax=Mycobacteroides salmoniphilum TaxID=404941 RepID=A0A4R8T011_9MYCO|nr:hypothetical protein [Mycobacteroides salmoniphilum]TEA09227.1 hypothetical protein CCUG60884_00217 [Mycobacteroides salmoniphilum]
MNGVGAGVAPIIQSIGWGVLMTVLFIAGITVIAVMCVKLVQEFKRSEDIKSGKFLGILMAGGGIAALCLGGGAFAVVRLMSAVNQQFGLQ